MRYSHRHRLAPPTWHTHALWLAPETRYSPQQRLALHLGTHTNDGSLSYCGTLHRCGSHINFGTLTHHGSLLAYGTHPHHGLRLLRAARFSAFILCQSSTDGSATRIGVLRYSTL